MRGRDLWGVALLDIAASTSTSSDLFALLKALEVPLDLIFITTHSAPLSLTDAVQSFKKNLLSLSL